MAHYGKRLLTTGLEPPFPLQCALECSEAKLRSLEWALWPTSLARAHVVPLLLTPGPRFEQGPSSALSKTLALESWLVQLRS